MFYERCFYSHQSIFNDAIIPAFLKNLFLASLIASFVSSVSEHEVYLRFTEFKLKHSDNKSSIESAS